MNVSIESVTGKGQLLTPRDLGIDRRAPDTEPCPSKRLTPFPGIPESGIDLTEIEKDLEKFYIEEAYKMAKGNESKAAQLLNLNHHTYRYRRRKLFKD
jgi:transcriptional regulator with PAS, ATPase and Fis domain